MSQAVLRPNLTKKFQWEVSQIGDKERSLAPLYRWFKCKLKPPKNESHFLDYIKTKKDTPSKNCWTKDKSGFFESVLACEANVNEDELLNLIDSGPVDAVLYGKNCTT